MTEFSLNGQPVEIADHAHLLAALRDELGIKSVKDGCAPSGQCGCCAVLIDGRATLACRTSVDSIAGRSVTTLEGLPEQERQRLAAAFSVTGALQCGFCTPGIMVRAKELLDTHGSELTRERAATRLGAHLCRCTGYTPILDAMDLLTEGKAPELTPISGLGSSGARYQSMEMCLGDRAFIADLEVDGMLHGALRLADHARADIERIDTSEAAQMPGVVSVLTAADVPGELKVGLFDQDWPVFVPEGGRTSYLGDVLAMVVAETRAQAQAAAETIEVTASPLRAITDPVAAIDDPEPAVWGTDSNVLTRFGYKRGNVVEALASSAHVVREVFETQRVEHAFLEPEATLAAPTDDDRLRVYSGGQGVWQDRDQIVRVLGIDTDRVVVEQVSNGGAFGGKEDLSNQAQTALAAWLLGRPVMCVLTREQSLLMHPKRHPMRMEYEAACDEDGKLTALRVELLTDSGAYASLGAKVVQRAVGHATGPYVIGAVEVNAVGVRTNNPVCGAFRGFGTNQPQFAMEGVVDRLAEQVGLDPLEFRRRNAIVPGAVWGPGQILDEGAAGAQACLDAIEPHYRAARAEGRACGIGFGMKSIGLGNGLREIARAMVRLDADGGVEVQHCWTEMGQGIDSVAIAVVTEELGVPGDRVRVSVDTSRDYDGGQTSGSRATLMGAGAIREACIAAREAGCPVDVEFEGSYVIDWTNSLDEGLEHPVIHSTFGYGCHLVVLDDDGRVERVVAAHDVGRAVNPQMCRGQVEGSVHMGLGYALSEDFPADEEARPLNMTLSSLGIIRPKDVPRIDTILLECPQPNAPYGIKGIGEIGMVPTPGAVASALRASDGQWRTQMPMRPKKGLQRKRAGEAPAGAPR